jgi:type II secretory pathway pseudopilin PulG
MRQRRSGVTIVELLVVFAILTMLLGLLLPAVQAARERARETVCKNNLHQINLAVGQFGEVHKRIPGPGSPGFVGGWSIDLLPFLEQKNLHDRATLGAPIPQAPQILLRQPGILRCPTRSILEESNSETMDVAHYVLVPTPGRKSCLVFDAPIELKSPWASGPEANYHDLIALRGPHHCGFYYAALSQGVAFILDGQRIR